MRGIGASTRLWNLIDRQPNIPLTGTQLFDKCHSIATADYLYQLGNDSGLLSGFSDLVTRANDSHRSKAFIAICLNVWVSAILYLFVHSKTQKRTIPKS